MKNTLALLVLLLSAVSARANMNPFSNFQSQAAPALIKPFALDLGGLLGSDTASTGRTIGFPGFWAGAVGAIQMHPDKNDLILRNAGVTAFGMPLIEAGVGLPLGIDVVLHGGALDGAKIYGGGLRYSLFRTDLLGTFLPNLSVAAMADKVNDSAFDAAHGGFTAAATWALPIIKPFFTAGYDITKVTVGATTPGVVSGAAATAYGTRLSAGAELTPFPFIGLRAAYTLRHGIPGVDLGLGVKF